MHSRGRFVTLLGVFVSALQLTLWMLPSSSLAAALGSSCELVELQVGYPGYRGYITGVDGIGDHACLEDLEDEDSFFDKDDEDRANRRAARALGIDGDPDVWTWENWLLIEAERELPPTCYSCAFAESPDRPEPRGTDIEQDDPRLVSGELGSDMFTRTWKAEHNYNISFVMQDYELRALAMLSYNNGYINAEQLIDTQENFLETIFTSTSPGFVDVRWVWDELVERGGAFVVPDGVDADDQVFIFYLGMMAMQSSAGDQNMVMLGDLVEQAHYDWLRDGSQDSFREYLQSIGADDWF